MKKDKLVQAGYIDFDPPEQELTINGIRYNISLSDMDCKSQNLKLSKTSNMDELYSKLLFFVLGAELDFTGKWWHVIKT